MNRSAIPVPNVAESPALTMMFCSVLTHLRHPGNAGPSGANAWLLSGSAHPSLAASVAADAGLPLGWVTVDSFPDGEIHVEIHDRMMGADVFVLQPMNSDRAILELLLLLDAAARAGARRSVAVLPYFGYARQDRRRGQEPLSGALMARLIEAAGASAVVTLDLHNQALEGCFRIPVIHLLPDRAFVAAWQQSGLNPAVLIIAAPDAGASKRAYDYCQAMGMNSTPVVLYKCRSNAGCEVLGLSGDVAGRPVMLVDDIVASGTTLLKGATLLREHGATAVYASVTHLVCPDSLPRLLAGPIERLFVSDSLPTGSFCDERLSVISVAPLLAAALGELKAVG